MQRIRPLITINGAGSQVDVSWAPVEVLDIVAASGELLDVNVENLLEERRENPTMPTLQGDFRVDARVQTPIGILQRSLWMASGGTAGVGWQDKVATGNEATRQDTVHPVFPIRKATANGANVFTYTLA